MPDSSYLLHDGDDWFVYVTDTYGDWHLYIDGELAEIASGTDAVRSRWYVTDHRPEKLELRHGPLKRTIAYRLPEGTHIEGLPREMAPDDWTERFWDRGEAEYSDPRGKLYEAVTEEYVPDPKPVETPLLELEGAPAVLEDGLSESDWVADLPYELRYRPEYRHLFPGYLVGFEGALVDQIKRVPGVGSAYESRTGEPLKVFYNLRYWPKPHRGRTLDGKRKDFQSVTKSLELRPPKRIEGINRAEAEQKWADEMQRWLSEVHEAVTGCICETCGGRFTPAEDRDAVPA